ncbi:D-isomer specific 2-hydroxyacid dehydrogenase family protein [Thermasporomyces composti]|uniref:Phosphoglycerate dehydrogenase-like enzyme n=1 Tax=Thermasporomyces composti TaxID=696763 RepID=A0A3D9V516_THECX|nr:D-isomer specific 2-hydroxyacid dehydrogenase family protein [Thermasporomyces composti]REF35793.1 phosphoglycerate dehydrogenase-like enzyme [Thermasporomyces composti]
MSRARTLKVYVGPQQAPELIDAVKGAGGQVCETSEAAEAIVWWGGSPQEYDSLHHDGIRWVQLPSAGVEGWFAAGVLRPGTTYTSAAGSYAETVAEHALALMLAGVRQLHTAARERSWSQPTVGALFDSTVGIVGCGGIGQALVRLLKPFRARVLAVTRSGFPVPGASRTARPDELDSVLMASDIVVLGAPATPQTHHLIGARELALMRPHTWLVNIARGSLVDTDALVEALEKGTIGGAALDVTDPEPLPDDHPLWTQPRALITPHSANPQRLMMRRLAERVAENVNRYLHGEELLGLIDLERGY